MTALSMEVRELSVQEIDDVSGGWIQVGRFVIGSIVGGMIYDGVKWVAARAPDLRTEQSSYTLAKIG